MSHIIKALGRHRSMVAIMIIQIMVTFAILTNALCVISHKIEYIRRPTGIAEKQIFMITQHTMGVDLNIEKLNAMELTDLDALRRSPNVIDAAPINALPMSDTGWDVPISTKSLDLGAQTHASIYFSDAHALHTLGLHLVSGRGFTDIDVSNQPAMAKHIPSIVIVTAPLAKALFQEGDAIGKYIYIGHGATPTQIVGVVTRLQTPGLSTWSHSFTWNSMIAPIRLTGHTTSYAVRVDPHKLDTAMRDSTNTLLVVNPTRVITSVVPFDDIRTEAYHGSRSVAMLLSGLCVLMVAINGLGIYGLASFWIKQRWSSVGLRRALGARRSDIWIYFAFENILITTAGIALGVLCSFALGLFLRDFYGQAPISPQYMLVGAGIVFAIGQGAVLLPAHKAAMAAPIDAMRMV